MDDPKLESVKKAINELFSDRSVDAETTKDRLVILQERCLIQLSNQSCARSEAWPPPQVSGKTRA